MMAELKAEAYLSRANLGKPKLMSIASSSGRLPESISFGFLYHNTQTIVDMWDICGLIVSKSRPIPFIVEPTVIELRQSERLAAAAWIAAIKPEQPVKVVAGTYGKWAHKFISPDSPPGELLSMGLKAAPPLIAALKDKSVSPEKRAWILALLYGLTGENDPRRHRCRGAVGDYDYIEGPRQVLGGKPGERPEGDVSFPQRLVRLVLALRKNRH